MVRILGTVKQNMLWFKEAEKLGLDEPITGSVRLTISSISFDKHTSYNCNYLAGKYISQTPTLEIIYKVGSSITEELQTGDLVDLYIYNNTIYYKPNNFVEIQEVPTGQIKFWHLKVGDNSVHHFYKIKNLSTNHPKKVTKSAEEIVNMLVELPNESPLNLTQPIPPSYSAPILKQLELA